MNGLIVVDMQNDFMDDGALPVPGAYDLVPTVNKLMASKNFDIVVGTQDWHPEDHGSFASNNEGSVGDIIELHGLDQILWPDHCVQYTDGAEFVSGLDTDQFDRIFQKGTNPLVDSYSGFYDNNHLEDTGLSQYLSKAGVTSVYVCGVAADYCVKFTVLDALEEGFETFLVWDGTEGVDMNEGDVDASLNEMVNAGAIALNANGHLL